MKLRLILFIARQVDNIVDLGKWFRSPLLVSIVIGLMLFLLLISFGGL